MHQQQDFIEEIEHLRVVRHDRDALKRRSGICNLDLYLDKKGLMRIRGRLKASNLHIHDVHPILIGKYNSFTRLL